MRLSCLTALAFALTACDPSAMPWNASGTIDVGDPRASYPPADVQLPPVPNLDLVDVPPTYDDGSYSVQGLMLSREDTMDQTLRVTGILQEVYTCAEGGVGVEGEAGELAVPNEPEDEFAVRAGCLRPHLYFVDHLRARNRLLVTGYDHAIYEPQITPGLRYTVVGLYSQQTRGFISTEDGLLIAAAIEGDGIVLPEPEPVE
jgi:hypothetical protein